MPELKQQADNSGLCILSLDGGGVRGLSTLFVLQKVMNRLNYDREKVGLSPVKPCDVFDMMAGTSTGGLIAIMLGRLEMSVDDCITAYTTLMKKVFSKNKFSSPVGLLGGVRSRFSSEALSQAISDVLNNLGVPLDQRLLVDGEPTCKVFVCAVMQKVSIVTRLRNYRLPEGNDSDPTILEAALATSAAPTYFSKVTIEGSTYIDGALGANNPATQLEDEARDIFCGGNNTLKQQVACFLSLGTGRMNFNSVSDRGILHLAEALKREATETDKTHQEVSRRWYTPGQESRYFRFNVEQGINEAKLAEFDKRDEIQAGTFAYLQRHDVKDRLQNCVEPLKTRQLPAIHHSRQETTRAEIREFIDRGDAKRNLPAHQITYKIMTEAIEQYRQALQRSKRTTETTPKERARIYQKLTQVSIKCSILAPKQKTQKEYDKAAHEYVQASLKAAKESGDECMVAQVEFLHTCVAAWTLCLLSRGERSDEMDSKAKEDLEYALQKLRRYPGVKMKVHEDQMTVYLRYLSESGQTT